MKTHPKGVTLVELMVAVAVLSIGIMGLISAFFGIQKLIQGSKSRTLAGNLAQEKMQILRELQFDRLVPTQSPLYKTNYSPSIPYDNALFPPDTILEGGVTFTRLTYIQVAYEDTVSHAINFLPPTTPDTGLKQITVTIIWNEGGANKKQALDALIASPNTVQTDASFNGTVSDTQSGALISNASVNIAQNIGQRATTDNMGKYSLNTWPGNYNLIATAPGYFPKSIIVTIAPNQVITQDFSLQHISSGTSTGSVWGNPNLLISQVVVSSVQPNGFDAEYVELFNPTTGAITINGQVNLNYVSGYSNMQCSNIAMTYVNNTVGPGNYYLMSNTSTIVLNGTTFIPDAYYADTANGNCTPTPMNWHTAPPPPPQVRSIMQRGHSGTIYITDNSNKIIDAVGWTNNGNTHTPSYCSGTCIPQPTNALPIGGQVVRASSPSFVDENFGAAYNSGNNSVDFAYPGNADPKLNLAGVQILPHTSGMPAAPIVAGVPAVGAVISCTDGLSSPTTAYLTGNPPHADFFLQNIATGTWSVFIASGGFQLENDTVTIQNIGDNYVFPSSRTILTSTVTAGFITGTVTDANLIPISAPGPITIDPNGAGPAVTASVANGRYFLRVSTGFINVTANPNNANNSYVSASSVSVPVAFGMVTDKVNFILSQEGIITAFVTRDGVNALEGISIVALDANGNTVNSQVSGVSGRVTLANLSSGTYIVEPAIDSLDTSSPLQTSVSLTVPGQSVFAATFTLSGALGNITGNVTLGGQKLQTGVLIVASTGTLAAPPALSASSLNASTIYIASSKEDGSYQIAVRQSTAPAYYVYGFYTTYNGGVPSISVKSVSGVQVFSGQTVGPASYGGLNFAW